MEFKITTKIGIVRTVTREDHADIGAAIDVVYKRMPTIEGDPLRIEIKIRSNKTIGAEIGHYYYLNTDKAFIIDVAGFIAEFGHEPELD